MNEKFKMVILKQEEWNHINIYCVIHILVYQWYSSVMQDIKNLTFKKIFLDTHIQLRLWIANMLKLAAAPNKRKCVWNVISLK